MGKLKKIGKGLGIVIAGFVLLSVVAVAMYPSGAVMTPTTTPKNQYDGLTEQQIHNVKMFAESCQTSVALASAYGPEHEKTAQEQCDRAVAHKIEAYRNQTSN